MRVALSSDPGSDVGAVLPSVVSRGLVLADEVIRLGLLKISSNDDKRVISEESLRFGRREDSPNRVECYPQDI